MTDKELKAFNAGKAMAVGFTEGAKSKGIAYDEIIWRSLNKKKAAEGGKKRKIGIEVPAGIIVAGDVPKSMQGKKVGEAFKQLSRNNTREKVKGAAPISTSAASSLKDLGVSTEKATPAEIADKLDNLQKELSSETLAELRKDPENLKSAEALKSYYDKLIADADANEDVDTVIANLAYLSMSNKLVNHLNNVPVDTTHGVDPLTDERISFKSVKSLSEYTDGALYEAINDAARSGAIDQLSKKDFESYSNIKDAFDKATPIPSNLDVYRGYQLTAGELNRVLKSREINDPAFLSTSTSEAVADDFSARRSDPTLRSVKVKITAPKGTKALNLENLSMAPDEKEILFNQGTRLKVHSFGLRKYNGRDQYYLEAELV